MDKILFYKLIVVVVTSSILIYKWCHSTTAAYFINTDLPAFTTLDPHDLPVPFSPTVLASLQNRLIDLPNFEFKINPNVCNNSEAGLLLIIIVSSNPLNHVNREILRNTWARPIDTIKIVFLVGESRDNETKQKIINESDTHNDIVQGNFIDTYRNLTYKHVMGLKWVLHNCPHAKYVLKTDDDIIVNVKGLLTLLVNELSPWGSSNLILCHVFHNARVSRSYRSKWRVSPMEYKDTHYPSYCAGWAILYSPDVVYKLYIKAQDSNYFWIDDAYISGILAERLKIDRTPIGSLELGAAQTKLLSSFKTFYHTGLYVFGSPELSPTKMKELWQAVQQD